MGEIGLIGLRFRRSISPLPSASNLSEFVNCGLRSAAIVGGYALAALLRALRMLIYFPVTAIVAPGGWATAKRPFSDFVAARTLPSKRNTFLPICTYWAWYRQFSWGQPPSA